jgi:hypothetical protein
MTWDAHIEELKEELQIAIDRWNGAFHYQESWAGAELARTAAAFLAEAIKERK